LRALGDLGSYTSSYTDVQAQAILAGKRPAHDRLQWGYETSERWGNLHTAAGHHAVPSGQGDYTTYYDLLAKAVQDHGEMPVTGSEAVAVLRVLDAARLSALEHQTISL
jgi:predicted dehydrogenase